MVYPGRSANVQAIGRVCRHDDPGSPRQLTGQNELLDVPPRQYSSGCRRTRCDNVICRNRLQGELRHGTTTQKQPAPKAPAVIVSEHEIFRYRHGWHDPHAQPVCRNVGQSCVCQGAHGTGGDVLPQHVDLSSLPRSQSGKHLDEFTSQQFDAVITLCDRVREVCPEFPSHPALAHWSMPDPAQADPTDQASYPAFEHTVEELETRIRFLVPLLTERSTSDETRRSSHVEH